MKKSEHRNWRNIFLRKKKGADEALVSRYYEELEKTDNYTQEGTFDRTKVFGRIVTGIEDAEARVRMLRRRWLSAAALVVTAGLSALAYQHRTDILNYIDPIAIIEKNTRKGEIAAITLADGSRVWLNADSRLRYPQKFRGNAREISLEGEAYFEIAQDAATAFLVHTGEVTTSVLGTSFNVKAYTANERITVAVLSGKVSVTAAADSTATYVTARQQAVYNKRQRSMAHYDGVDAMNAAAWKEGKMICKKALLADVVATLQHRFDVTITIDEALEHCSISGDFSNEPVDRIITVLAELVNGKVVRQDNHYHVKGGGC